METPQAGLPVHSRNHCVLVSYEGFKVVRGPRGRQHRRHGNKIKRGEYPGEIPVQSAHKRPQAVG